MNGFPGKHSQSRLGISQENVNEEPVVYQGYYAGPLFATLLSYFPITSDPGFCYRILRGWKIAEKNQLNGRSN